MTRLPRTKTLLLIAAICLGVGCGVASAAEPGLPPQAPMFLKDLPPAGKAYQPEQLVTKQLQEIIDEHEGYRAKFNNAIRAVSSKGIPELEPIKTLDQFYFYVDALATWIPEIRVWRWDGKAMHERTVYLRIVQFYYYFNQPSLVSLQNKIKPGEGEELTPVSRWLRNFAVEWGSFLDTEASRKYLESFKYAPEYAWQDYEKAPEDYATFNEYFAREFKDINVQRPVASQNNDQVIVFPAESTYVGQWAVSTPVGEPLEEPASIVVKHIEWSIRELLENSEYAECFEGGTFCHTFLNTYDYHRLHTPVAGKVLEAKFTAGQVYLEVELKKQGKKGEHGDLARAVIPKRFLDANDPTGYQFVQCRGMLVLDSEIGKVAVLPIGMAQVSSVVFVEPKAAGHEPIKLEPEEKRGKDYQEQVDDLNEKIYDKLVGKLLQKGEMFAHFAFGGSDCVMVFERKANVNVTAKVEVHYPIRSQFAVSNMNK